MSNVSIKTFHSRNLIEDTRISRINCDDSKTYHEQPCCINLAASFRQCVEYTGAIRVLSTSLRHIERPVDRGNDYCVGYKT